MLVPQSNGTFLVTDRGGSMLVQGQSRHAVTTSVRVGHGGDQLVRVRFLIPQPKSQCRHETAAAAVWLLLLRRTERPILRWHFIHSQQDVVRKGSVSHGGRRQRDLISVMMMITPPLLSMRLTDAIPRCHFQGLHTTLLLDTVKVHVTRRTG